MAALGKAASFGCHQDQPDDENGVVSDEEARIVQGYTFWEILDVGSFLCL
jgi:hypothetical protein